MATAYIYQLFFSSGSVRIQVFLIWIKFSFASLMKQARRDVCLLRNHSFPSQNNDLFWTEGEQSDIHTISCNLCSQNHVKNKKLLSSENPHLATRGNLGFPALLSEISIFCSFYPESFLTPGNKGLEHKVSCTLKYREHPGWCVCVCVWLVCPGWHWQEQDLETRMHLSPS